MGEKEVKKRGEERFFLARGGGSLINIYRVGVASEGYYITCLTRDRRTNIFIRLE